MIAALIRYLDARRLAAHKRECRIAAEIDAALAYRRIHRAEIKADERSKAARKGWQTRRGVGA